MVNENVETNAVNVYVSLCLNSISLPPVYVVEVHKDTTEYAWDCVHSSLRRTRLHAATGARAPTSVFMRDAAMLLSAKAATSSVCHDTLCDVAAITLTMNLNAPPR
jgi:hypothetical protein